MLAELEVEASQDIATPEPIASWRKDLALEQYKQIFEHAVEGIFQSTPDGRYLAVNPAFARMYGYESPEDLMSSVKNIAHEVYVDPSIRRQFQEIVARDGRVEALEFQIYRKDRSIIWISEYARVVKDEQGQVLYYEGFIQNVTRRKEAELALQKQQREQKALELQLRQAQKMEAIGTLAGGIAHDFNNILGAIIGFSELIMEDLDSEPHAKSNMEHLRKAAFRARELVQQILAFSRTSDPERQVIQLSKVLKDALKILRPSTPSNIEVTLELISEEDFTVADPVQVHQILMNLCSNAVYVMQRDGGSLSVALTEQYFDEDAVLPDPDLRPGRYLRLDVRDTGPGMDSKTLERVFEPFFTTKPVGQGTGLGLSVVHGIVKSHKGAITVSSEPGLGTTFTVFFPKSPVPGSPIPIPHAGETHRGAGERILLVEDEAPLLQLMEEYLSRLGYQISTFQHSSAAMQEFRSNPARYDLVMTDQTMPQFTGCHVIQEIRSIRPEMPIILCTGHKDRLLTCANPIPSDVVILGKPLDFPAFSRTLRHLLSNESHHTHH